jgi:hypothetical protein
VDDQFGTRRASAAGEGAEVRTPHTLSLPREGSRVVAPSEGSGRLRSGTAATPDPSHITLPPLGWCAACYTAGKFMPAAEQPVGTMCSFHADKGPQRPAVGWFASCVGAFRVTPIPGAPGAAKVVLDPGQLTRGLAHTPDLCPYTGGRRFCQRHAAFKHGDTHTKKSSSQQGQPAPHIQTNALPGK